MSGTLLERLRRDFGHSGFLPGQMEVLERLDEGRDVLAVMPTGSGKSLCYQLPALHRPGVTLVVSPLIALMKDQTDQLSRRDFPAAFVNSTLSFSEQSRRLRLLRKGSIRLLYLTPERFRSRGFQAALEGVQVGLFAVDEAHCISSWGHDFRPDYLRLKEAAERLGGPQLLALTATATPRVRQDIVETLGMRTPAVIVAGFDRPNLFLEVRQVRRDYEKFEILSDLLTRSENLPAVVYAGSRRNVEKVAGWLQGSGVATAAYHAGLDKDRRSRVQERFMLGDIPVIAATNAFGMGIDKADIRSVIHFNFPRSLEAYYQEIGRAGRDGLPARCVLLYNYADRWLQEFLIDGGHPPRLLVEKVYRFLDSTGEEVEVATREIAAGLAEKNEVAIHSSLVLLEKAGYLERLFGTEHRAEIHLNPALKGSLAGGTGPVPDLTPQQERVLDALFLAEGGSDAAEGLRPRLSDLARRTGIDVKALRRVLQNLDGQGLIRYRPPFRGRGIRVLRRGETDLSRIDFQELERHRLFEIRSLERVLDYAAPFRKHCLRGYLLGYFGEWASGHSRCDACGNCRPGIASAEEGRSPAGRRRIRHGASTKSPRTRPGRRDGDLTVALKILSCVCRCENQFGRRKIARILKASGSREVAHMRGHRTWGLLADLTEARILERIDVLLERGLIRVTRKAYPTLGMTPEGIQFLKARPEDFRF